ncbi:hypothetical protein ScPMuIL_004002 [Solemya velum]
MARKKKGKSARKAQQNQLPNQEEEYRKAPHTFVFPRGHVGKNIRQLIRDVRRVMEPYTASKLQAGKKNVLKDYVSVAGPLHVTHFLMFTKTDLANNLKVARLPKGPTLTFKLKNYCLVADLISSLKRPNYEQKQFMHPPLLVMNNFSGEGLHTKLMTTMFQNMFPSLNVNKIKLNTIKRCLLLNYDPDTKTLELRHYNVRIVPVGMSRGVKKLIQAKVPDMGRFTDISEYVYRDGNLSESEVELEGPDSEVVVPQHLGSRGNIKSAKSAVRLTELGPRLTLQLVKIEEGLCNGEVLFHEFIQKSAHEMESIKAFREKKRKLKESRRQQQLQNVKRKEKEKEEHKKKSLSGMKAKEADSDSMDDADYYRQEVGQEPDPELFPKRKKRKQPIQEGPVQKKSKTLLTNSKTKSFSKVHEKKMGAAGKKGQTFKHTKRDDQVKNFKRRTKPMNKAKRQPKRTFKSQSKKHSKPRGRK